MGTGDKRGILFRKREALIVRAGAEENAARCPPCFLFQRKRNFAPTCRGDGRQRGYSLSQKRIPPLKPPEKGLIGSLDLEGVQRLRSGSTCVAALLRSPPLALRYDLTCSYYPLPLCLSCFSADESPPTVSPIKAASKAKPPPSPASPAKRRRAQQCRRPQAVRRQTTVTRAPRSRARLIPVTTRRRLVAKPRTPHLHCAARAALQAANCQCRGSRGTPLVLLWGIQRGYSLREENTPFARQQRKELH